MASNGGRKPTPVSAQRRIAAAPDTTSPAPHRLPVSGPEKGQMTLRRRTPTAAVTGPPAWENGRDSTSTPSGTPPLRGTTAADCHPCPPGSGSCT